MAAPHPPPLPPPESKPSSAVVTPATSGSSSNNKNNTNSNINNNNNNLNNNNRSARRSLAKDLCREQLEALSYNSPRLFTKKHLLLLQQQQRQYQFVADESHSYKQTNLLNSRRVYPSSSVVSSRTHLHRNINVNGEVSSNDCSNHGSPHLLLPRKVPKKMVVDEKQLAMKLLRARNALACSSSSTSTSSSSSENASLRASAEAPEFPPRSSALELSRRSFLSGCAPKSQASTVIHPRAVSLVGYSRNGSDCESGCEKKVACVGGTGSGRSSDAEESVRSVRSLVVMRQERRSAPVLVRSASCSSATPSRLNKMVRLKAADMPPGMQEHAFYCANEVLEGLEKLYCKRVAWALKKEFDKSYGPAWHCVVGTSFGSYVTHSVGGFLYFSIGKVSVLLFQTAVELIEHQ